MSKKFLAAILAASLPMGTVFGATVYTDDFSQAYNYATGIVAGGAPTTGTSIWSGVWNIGQWNYVNRADENIPFNSNTDAPGELRVGPTLGPTSGSTIGWEGGHSDAPVLFVRIPANNAMDDTGNPGAFDFRATVKISTNTFANWTNPGIIARSVSANPPSGSQGGANTDENAVLATLFNGPTTWGNKRIENGAQPSDANGAYVAPIVAGLPIYLRLTRSVDFFLQPQYVYELSNDGVNFVQQNIQIPTAGTLLADRTAALDVGLQLSTYPGGNADTVNFDDFKLEYPGNAAREIQAPPPPVVLCTECTWIVNGTGSINAVANWRQPNLLDPTTSAFTSAQANTQSMVIGASSTGTAGAVLYTDSTVTTKEIRITNATQHIILGGPGQIVLDSPDANPAQININSAPATGHEIQVKLSLADNVVATAAATTVLNINAPIVLNGHTFATAGAGTINLNNGTISAGSGAGSGALVNGASLNGLSGVEGDLTQTDVGSLGVTVGGSPISVTGSAVLDGVLNVSVADGFNPVIGHSYTVLTASSVVNGGLGLSGDDASMFRLSFGSGSVSLTAVPEPATIMLFGFGAIVVGMVRRRRSQPLFFSNDARTLDFNNKMRKALTCIAALVTFFGALAASETMAQLPAPTAPLLSTRTDAFDAATDFQAAVYPSGIWTGLANGTNGGGVASSAGGALTMEDLRTHANPDAQFGVGWEGTNAAGGTNNAPYLYTTIDSPAGKAYDFDAFAKISSQWNGNWSKSAVVIRGDGPGIGKDHGSVAPFAATENFLAAAPFLPQANFQVQRVNNGADQGILTGTAASRAPLTTPFETTPIWVAVTKRQTSFRFFTSVDDVATPDLVTTWVDTGLTSTNTPLYTDGGDIQVGLSHHEFFDAASGGGIGAGDRPSGIYDYFSVKIYDNNFVNLPLVGTWNINNDGNWNTNGNWLAPVIGAQPNGNSHQAVFGSVITSPRTIFMNNLTTARTLKQLTFDNVNSYSINGSQRLNMAANTGNAKIEALQGSHIIGVPITLLNATDIEIINPAARLDFNNDFNINGQTVTVTGGGRVSINSTINDATDTGTVNSTGNLGGSGRINGALNVNGGSLNPGSSVGTMTVDSGFTMSGASTSLNIELAGTAAGLFDRVAVTGAATIGGRVDVSTIGGFSPAAGNTWDIVAATGALTSTATMAPGDSGYSLSVIGGNTLRLTFTGGLLGDYNQDGTVNAADYTVYRNRKAGIGGTTLPNDATPGSVAFEDYTYWKNHYGAMGSGSSVDGSGTSVPEPTSFALLALAFLGAFGFIRQR